MERLTEWRQGYLEIKGTNNATCKEICEGMDCNEGCPINDVIRRLAEYEDTGITPQQIRDIDKLYAEKCRELAEYQKSKSTVYAIDDSCLQMAYSICKYYLAKENTKEMALISLEELANHIAAYVCAERKALELG